jgi:hypothetical protein
MYRKEKTEPLRTRKGGRGQPEVSGRVEASLAQPNLTPSAKGSSLPQPNLTPSAKGSSLAQALLTRSRLLINPNIPRLPPESLYLPPHSFPVLACSPPQADNVISLRTHVSPSFDQFCVIINVRLAGSPGGRSREYGPMRTNLSLSLNFS